MRVPSLLLQQIFMNQYSSSKTRLSEIQTQIATQSNINKPSDNPLGNARLMSLTSQLEDINAYKKNIDHAQSFVDSTITSMEGIQSEIQKLMADLTQMQNATNDNKTVYADKIDAVIENLLDMSNSEFNNQYLFAGTDYGRKPFSYDGNSVTYDSLRINDNTSVRISKQILQKTNMTGSDLFVPTLRQAGNIDSTAGVGVPQTTTTSIYDADGNEYSMDITYTMTAANTYDMQYSITDSDSNVIQNTTVNDLVYDASGKLQTIGGNPAEDIKIEIPGNKINLLLDVNGVRESNSASSISNSLSQKADIFNTLISMRDALRNDEDVPTSQIDIVNEFNAHVLNKLSIVGNSSVRLQDTASLLTNQSFELESLISKERDVDIARATLELENQNYSLQLSYRVSSMLLPKSLMDYL